MLSIAFIFTVYDITLDIYSHVAQAHIINELLVSLPLVVSLVALNIMRYKTEKRIYTNVVDLQYQIISLSDQLKNISSALNSLILTKFKEWKLSKSEAEIGFLLLKGFSTQEIADLRSSSEGTVREQCSRIYQKANLRSRSELSAFFLEGLM
jgi:DNA-binding CsgD family transcriptional regulator